MRTNRTRAGKMLSFPWIRISRESDLIPHIHSSGMPTSPQLSDRIFELSLKRSFFFPSNEPYGGTAGLYDYGPVGVLIKRKIENLWREMFIKSEGFHEVETSIITPEPVLVASGHVGSFADPVIECQKCKAKVRADSFV